MPCFDGSKLCRRFIKISVCHCSDITFKLRVIIAPKRQLTCVSIELPALSQTALGYNDYALDGLLTCRSLFSMYCGIFFNASACGAPSLYPGFGNHGTTKHEMMKWYGLNNYMHRHVLYSILDRSQPSMVETIRAFNWSLANSVQSARCRFLGNWRDCMALDTV